MNNIQQGMSPQLYMSMHVLNNLYNINVRHQRLDNINNDDDRQHYNLIDIHHLIATSYNHHVNSVGTKGVSQVTY